MLKLSEGFGVGYQIFMCPKKPSSPLKHSMDVLPYLVPCCIVTHALYTAFIKAFEGPEWIQLML
jgi:hypothetical protein